MKDDVGALNEQYFRKRTVAFDLGRFSLYLCGIGVEIAVGQAAMAAAFGAIAAYMAFFTVSLRFNLMNLRASRWFWYSSTAADGMITAAVLAQLGNINSIAACLFIAEVAATSLNPHLHKGVVMAAIGSLSFVCVGLLALLGLVPKMNILGAGSEITPASFVLYSLFFVICILSTESGVSRVARRSERLLKENEEERRRSEALLLNVLPEAVARELKEKGRYAPRRIEGVTVLFTDFAGFARATAGLDPALVVARLDEIFHRFDEIIAERGLEKLKTLGDGYMCAGGLQGESAEGCAGACAAALDMLRAMEEERGERALSWGMRIGLNYGPVVAGIIGRDKFSYDIWGDTVNVASRMESSGLIGGVNVSASVRELAKDRFAFRPRGLVEIKGGDRVEMFELRPGRA